MSNPRLMDLKGIYYGYPLCCIEEYSEMKYPSAAFKGTGFVCCNECAKKDPMQLIEEINENRVCVSGFPNQPPSDSEYEKMYDSGLLFKVLIYRQLSGQSNTDRIEVIKYYQESLEAEIRKLGGKTVPGFRSWFSTLDKLKLQWIDDAVKHLDQCEKKVNKLIKEGVT